MSLSRLEIAQLIEDTSKHDPFQNWKQRDDQMHLRSLYVKHDPQLEWLRDFYPQKLKRIADYYNSFRDGLDKQPMVFTLDEALAIFEAKIRRLSEKLRDTRFEIRGRGLNNLKRNPIGTEYFIDLDSGDNGNDGLTPGNPWLTIEQFTTTSVRSPGDIAWVRAGTSEAVGGDVAFDEDGNYSSRIYIIGCTAGSGSGSDSVDPWGDDDDTRPVFDFQNADRKFAVTGDDFWSFRNLELTNVNNAQSGLFYIGMSKHIRAESCKFHNQNHATTGAVIGGLERASAKFEDCEFADAAGYYVLSHADAELRFVRCKIDGPGVYGYFPVGGRPVMEDCEFGQTTGFTTGDFWITRSSPLFRRCVFSKSASDDFTYEGNAWFEDCVPAASPYYPADGWASRLWVVQKDTANIRAGGGPESAHFKVSAVGGPNLPASLSGYMDFNPGPLVVMGEADVALTISVYIKATSAFATYPTAAELFLQAEYLDSDLSGEETHRAMAYSDEVLSDDSTWVAFQVVITPKQDGPIFLNVYLGKSVSGKGIYVDLTPVVT